MQSALTSLLQTQQNAAAMANSGLRGHAASSTSATTANSSTAAAVSAASATSATITANDFLSLLVTEIQNQDPTTQTDPMEYITQLVDVNSLEQLVQINQDLAPGSSGATASLATAPGTVTAKGAAGTAKDGTASTNPGTGTGANASPLDSHAPVSGTSAQAVAQALGRSTPMAAQAPATQLPPSHVAVQPETLRAIEMSIPGAALTSAGAAGTLVPVPTTPGGGAH